MKTFKSDKFWNFMFTLTFISLTVISWYLIEANNIKLSDLGTFDLFIIGLATFRLTRLLIYDEVFYYVKDYVKKFKTEEGFVKSAAILLTCPWCIGVWMALISLVAYVLIPYGKFIVIVLALSAISSFFHLIITWLGWTIDEKKTALKNQKNKESDIRENNNLAD